MTEQVILLPGLLCDSRVWAHQLLHLTEHRPVTLVQPCGATVEEMSNHVLAAAPARFALVGLGMGGGIALDIVRRMPERVSRLVLISTDPLPEPPAVAAIREARMVAARAGRLWQALAEEYPVADMGARGPEVQARLREMAEHLGEGVYLAQSRAMQRRPDQQKALRKATMPTLILGGARDTLVPPRRHEFTAKLMPAGRLRILEGVGHLLPLEAPEVVTTALETFLRGPMLLK
ncbi:alpha/beta fold hydrolase [Gemmobacter serpentinus]|uniref:alpha/beta fold hydrolase n=1 Tax=Gemmobacter serpentinus TaxID=2652247 RepID=UPI00124D121D|nr:alpha/beta hydrolase [Gemmobacter serpentinus]